MNELALFAGVGGGILGGKLLGWRTVCAVEIDEYCREVLLQRQRDRVLEMFPIWDDAKTFDGQPWCGIVDIVSAGFPCQPFSIAGQRKGENDKRNLWPETIRIIRQVRPRFALLENVPNLLAHKYIRRIFGDLAESGYNCRWDVLSASAFGLPHRRDRLWIVADSMRQRRKRMQRLSENTCEVGSRGKSPFVSIIKFYDDPSWWEKRASESYFLGRNDVVPNRVDRIRAIGNGQIPRVVEKAWKELNKNWG